MAIVSEGSLAILVRTWVLMLVFCFAGCAAGSCLSYGHSCWGAHGKRNGHVNNNPHLGAARAIMKVDGQQQQLQQPQDVPSAGKEQWILSRLISGRPLIPLSSKHRGKWSNLSKMRPVVPHRWDVDDVRSLNEDLIRGRIENDNDDGANEIEANEERDISESPDILLISPDDYNEPPNKPQIIDLFKLLSKPVENIE